MRIPRNRLAQEIDGAALLGRGMASHSCLYLYHLKPLALGNFPGQQDGFLWYIMMSGQIIPEILSVHKKESKDKDFVGLQEMVMGIKP